MRDIWFVSDTHWRHENMLKFTPPREFSSVYEMDEKMVEEWNRHVKDGHVVYHLGDVAFGPSRFDDRTDEIMRRLNGRKRLLVGNHDDVKSTPVMKYFQKVGVWRVFGKEGFVCSHVPIHESCFPGECVLNVHGHTHNRDVPGPYMNVSVEKTGYAPVHIDTILSRVAKERRR